MNARQRERFFGEDARVIDEELGRKVVAPVHHDVVAGDQGLDVGRLKAHGMGLHLHQGVDLPKHSLGAFNLGPANGLLGVENLPM